MKLSENPKLVEKAEEIIWGVIGARELLKGLPAEAEQAHLEATITAAVRDILDQVEEAYISINLQVTKASRSPARISL